MAIKGSSVNDDSKEIFTTPRPSVDLNARQKAKKYGLRPFIVGTARAKDLILGVNANAGRVKLTGDGPGRLHWYKGVREDYWEQLLSEVKAPGRLSKKLVWQKKTGVRNEALDCEVYALHAARSLKLFTWSQARWDLEMSAQTQPDLFESSGTREEVQDAVPDESTQKIEAPAEEPKPKEPAPKPQRKINDEYNDDEGFGQFGTFGDFGW